MSIGTRIKEARLKKGITQTDLAKFIGVSKGARGKHQVAAMSDIVLELYRRNWSDKKIARELGMEPDEVLRLKQITGLAELFMDQEFSEAWEGE